MESERGIPTVGIAVQPFKNLVNKQKIKRGMPNLRMEFVNYPVWGKTPEQLQKYVEGTSPETGNPFMPEILSKLTTPLAPGDKKTGIIKQTAGPSTYGPDTEDNLRRFFIDNHMTDYLPIILPTKEKVDAMLKATSHDPDEVVGKIAPTPGYFESWSYTVRTVAVNAVMAGAKPEYFPAILAVASAGIESLSSSDNSFASFLVFNGPIRDELGMNYRYGAMGPFSEANSTIGRAWTLLSLNGGNAGKPGVNYMAVVGNPTNWVNIIIPENEQDSPWKPFSVQKGFKPNENVVSIFVGWGVLSSANSAKVAWTKEIDFAGQMKALSDDQGWLFGATFVLSPVVANLVKDEGYDSMDKLVKFLYQAPGQKKPHFRDTRSINVLVTGTSNNLYWDYGGARYMKSVKIDDWR
jgi:hypothetical protein